MKTEKKTKRDDILEVASRLFYEQGYHQTGIAQIIQEAGTAKGTFYTFFKSKDELGLAWLKQRHVIWSHWMKEAIATKRSAKTKILGLFEFLGSWMSSCNYRGCAFLNTLAEVPNVENPMRKEIAAHKRSLLRYIRSLVDEHRPEATEGQQEQLAGAIFLLFEGSLLQLENFREDWPLEIARKQVCELLIA